MKNLKNVLFLCLLVAFCNAAFAQTAERQPPVRLGDLRTGVRSLVVGGVAEFSPFNEVGSNGEMSGMDRQIIRAIAKRVGIQSVQFKTMWFSELSDALESGKIDVIANNYWITPDRQRLFLFTIPYYLRGGVGLLYNKSAANYRSAKDLSGKRIAVFKGSYEEQWVRDNVANATIVPLDTSAADLENTLTNGQADAIVGFYTRQKTVPGSDRNDRYDSLLLQPMRAAFAVRKSDPQLRDMLNDGLKAIWTDGSLLQIKAGYLDPLGIEASSNWQ